MGAAAVAAARAVGYRSAGTVEFILDSLGRFYFLEMNTRLQVEHPITEMTTGLDLVREQILVASGLKLRYAQSDLRQTGHSMECRIYAEVPEEDFRPATGTVEIFDPPMGPGIRLDTGIAQGSAITHHFDPMLGKLVVWAPSRDASIQRMKRALDDFVLLGVRNNIDFLHRVISTEDFAAGKINTGFLTTHSHLLTGSTAIPPEAVALASMKQVTTAAKENAFADAWASGPWRNA
jgi:acetyl/propionyl-CoA carboxylase alpha subunit